MAVFTIAGLTLREAVRRRTLIGALLLGLLGLGLSLLLMLIRHRVYYVYTHRHHSSIRLANELVQARCIVTALCLSYVRMLGSLFAILLAAGSISSEIERGLLAVILPKPIPRWQILLGKWVGLNAILTASVLSWTIMIWASLTWQSGSDLRALFRAGCYLALFPMVLSSVTLSLSTFAQRLFGTSLALTFAILSWFDGIFDALGTQYDVESLHTLANLCGLLVPQGTIAWWVEDAAADLLVALPPVRLGHSPRFLMEWGESVLHISNLDAYYVALYVVAVFIAGATAFQKRDV